MQNEIYDEKNGLTYMLCGDYYLPELALTDIEPTYGKYGMLRKSYLQEHRKAKYQILLLQGKLVEHLNQIDAEARDREGDLSIHTMDNCSPEMSFPLKHYRGISVVINLKIVAKNPSEILSESGIDILDFKEKFCAEGNCFVMRAKDEIEHIFSELYCVPDCLQKPYFKIKVQELFLFLCMVDVSKEKQREQYTSPQVEVVREIHKKLTSNLQVRPTIEELSKEYLINTASLKDTFKGIYGQPIGAYMKEYRIKQAAVLLRQTQYTIAEVANQVGYENQSKFATAFRDVLKIAPAEYRKQNSSD